MDSKLYIGKTKDVNKRWLRHQIISRGGKNTHQNTYNYLHAAIAKHGIENFTITTLSCYELEEQALLEEIRLIAQYKADGYQLYNLTDGGEGISGWKHSEATKHKMSIVKTGECNYFYGKHHTEEAKQKISDAQLGKHNSLYGKKHSKKTKQKMSDANSGENNHSAKLTWNEVNKIRELFLRGISNKDLSIQFKVNENTISRILHNKLWKIK